MLTVLSKGIQLVNSTYGLIWRSSYVSSIHRIYDGHITLVYGQNISAIIGDFFRWGYEDDPSLYLITIWCNDTHAYIRRIAKGTEIERDKPIREIIEKLDEWNKLVENPVENLTMRRGQSMSSRTTITDMIRTEMIGRDIATVILMDSSNDERIMIMDDECDFHYLDVTKTIAGSMITATEQTPPRSETK